VALRIVERSAPAEADLVAACVRGDRAAERELFRREYPRVLRLVYRLVGSSRDLDDILQETFIAVFRGLPRFRGESLVSTFLYRITVNVAYDHLRSRARHLFFSEEIGEGGSGSVTAPATVQVVWLRRAGFR